MEMLRTMWTDDSGQDLAEYAMLVALIAFIVIAGVTLFGGNLLAWWNGVAGTIGGWATG
ncbi:MAG TPA: Flp family type IVb pilin [Clostridia bacterium]|nr:Flp family type IVb pilin [Clostridia bacterium]